jgi:predicted NAD/FAD-dependent oxidoreductase
MQQIAIIGAGLSGLVLARELKGRAAVTVFEKSRGTGGRMATRRAGPYRFDHGAQYFTARSAAFNRFLQPLIAQGVVAAWDATFVELDRQRVLSQRHWDMSFPHYVAVPAMNQLGRHLAAGLDVRLRQQVAGLEYGAGRWQLFDEHDASLGHFDWVVSTAPAAQSALLLPPSFAGHATVEAARMVGCHALMLGFSDTLPIPWQAALIRAADISWISVNSSKPGRPGAFSLVVHATNAWSEAHMEDDEAQVRTHLLEQASEVIGHDLSQADQRMVHRWRYANIGRQHGERSLLDTERRLAACGDWCVHGRVEGAFTSASDLAARFSAVL